MYNAKHYEKEIKKAIENSKTMVEASKNFDFNIKTFRRLAKELNLWDPNQSGKGTIKLNTSKKYPIEKILSNELPMQSNKLRKKLFDEGYKEAKCEICGGTHWLNREMPLEVHHIDGNNKNNNISNLIIICPNCHTFTEKLQIKK